MVGDNDEEEIDRSLYSLQLGHEKLDKTLTAQSDHAEHIDTKAIGTLRSSFTFSGVAAAIIYYISRQESESILGTIDNPFTYAALAFGISSFLLSFTTIYHTKLERELTPKDIKKQTEFDRKEFLTTIVETYPQYIRKNKLRIEDDKNFLGGAQLSLFLAIVCTILSGVLYLNERGSSFYLVLAVTFFVGSVIGGGIVAFVYSHSKESTTRSKTE